MGHGQPSSRAAEQSTASERLSAWAVALELDAIPRRVLEVASLHVLDTLGCAMAASALAIGREGLTVAAAQGGLAEAEVVGLDQQLPAPLAALANGTLAHALDFDDTHPASICHVSAVVAPAALAVAQAVGASGAEALRAYVCGAEAVTRIGIASSGRFHARGFHPTGACGVFGAALAAALLLGLDERRVVAALGIAGSFTVGLLEFLGDGATTKRIHAGGAAQAGVQAALLARAGGEGPRAVLEGRDGLFASHLGATLAPELAAELVDLGVRYETLALAVKPYPCCHFLHGTLEALARIVDGERLAAADVVGVHVRVAETAARMVLEPEAAKRRPRTPYDGKFSLPFTVGALLVRGVVDVATFTDAVIGDPAIAAIAARVTYDAVPLGSVASPFGGAVAVTLRDGRRLEAVVDHPRGSGDVPLGDDEIRAKFRTNAGLLLSSEQVAAYEERVLGLMAAPGARISSC